MSIQKTPLALAVITSFYCTFALPAFANDMPMPSVTLPDIVVTGTRIPIPINDSLVQTQVIDQDDLKRHQGQTALEVLKRQLGFSIKQDGSMGQSGNFYVRGFDSKRVLVLIDGVRYGSMSVGQPALNLLPAEHIDRIEVIYGAMGSSVYGSDAMGGVIQIFTKGTSQPLASNYSATIGYGSNNHYLYGMSGQWVGSRLSDSNQAPSLSLSASHNQTDGISSLARQTSNNKDDDGYQSNNFSLVGKLPLSNQFSVGITGLYANSETEFDDFMNTKDAHIKQKNGAVSLFADYRMVVDNPSSIASVESQKISSTTPFGIKLVAGQSLDNVDNNVGDEFTTRQNQVTLTGDYTLPITTKDGQTLNGNLIGGLEWLEQKVEVEQNAQRAVSDTYAFDKDNRTIRSAFAGYQLTSKQTDIQLNVRFDDNSQYGNQTTYGIGLAQQVGNSFRIGVNHATGFRAPTLSDLYIDSPYYVANPKLDVETSNNTEAFIEHQLTHPKNSATTRLTGYYSTINDLISNEYDVNSGKFQAKNVDDTKIVGASLKSDWTLGDYGFGVAYNYTDATDESNANKGKQLVYRPKHSGVAYVSYDELFGDLLQKGVSIRAELQHVGERYNSYDNRTKLPNYQLLNLSANYELSENWQLTTRINNVLNENYSTNETFGDYGTRYNTDGTNYLLSLTYKSSLR